MNNLIYQKIINPNTGRPVKLKGKQGKHVLNGYLSHLAKISQLGGSGGLENLSEQDIKDIILNAPPGGRWNKNEVNTLSKLDADKLKSEDYDILYDKVWNSIDSFMKVQNTKCNPNGSKSGMFKSGDCWNSNTPLKSSSGLFNRSKGHILGNPGQSAVSDYCSYLMKNTAEREMGKGTIDFKRSNSKSTNTTQHYLGENSECSTLCSSIQDHPDAEVRKMTSDVIKMLSADPNSMDWKKYINNKKWSDVIKTLKACSKSCPINLLNTTCGYIIKNQGVSNGVPITDLCAFQSSSPTLQKACNISDELWLDTINLTRSEICNNSPNNPKCYGYQQVTQTIPTTEISGNMQPGQNIVTASHVSQPGQAVPFTQSNIPVAQYVNQSSSIPQSGQDLALNKGAHLGGSWKNKNYYQVKKSSRNSKKSRNSRKSKKSQNSRNSRNFIKYY